MGRNQEAVAARERAVELDPLNARTRITLGSDYLSVGDRERALAEFQRAARLDPVNPLALGLGPAPPLGPITVYLAEGRQEDAVLELVRIAMLRGSSPGQVQSIRTAWEAAGMPAVWRAWLDLDLSQSGDRPDALRVASLWALAGDTVRTFDWLERAFDERNPGLIYLMGEPAFRTVRSHPRFLRIAAAIRLPPQH
jgi:tetratricopeptide (TPR) repeat protein